MIIIMMIILLLNYRGLRALGGGRRLRVPAGRFVSQDFATFVCTIVAEVLRRIAAFQLYWKNCAKVARNALGTWPRTSRSPSRCSPPR